MDSAARAGLGPLRYAELASASGCEKAVWSGEGGAEKRPAAAQTVARLWPGPLSWPCPGPEHPHIQLLPTTQPSYDGAPTRSCAQKIRAFAGLWRVVGVSEALWEPWGLHSQLYTLGISSQNSVGVVFLFHQAPA